MKKNLFGLVFLAATCACDAGEDLASLSFSVVDNRVIAIGEIDAGSLEAFGDIVEDNPEVRTLVLKYIGGSLDDAANVAFGRVVRDRGFTTVVPADGLVASGGTDLFLAGITRKIEPGACVGVHSWSADGFTATDISRSSAEHERYLDYYEEIGIDPNFYWFTIEAAPADAMHWMTPLEVDRYGVSTTPVNSLSKAAICDSK